MTHKTQCLPSFVNVIDRPGPDQQKLCDWSDITRYTLHIARYTLHVTHYTAHHTSRITLGDLGKHENVQ